MQKKDLETATMKLKNYLHDSEDNKRKSKLRCAIERFCVENNESSFKLEYYALGHQTDLHSCGYWASVYRACILKGEPYLEKCLENKMQLKDSVATAFKSYALSDKPSLETFIEDSCIFLEKRSDGENMAEIKFEYSN